MGKRVLVLRQETKSQTSGGIILPEVAQETPRRGTVVAVGDPESKLQAGDEVLLPRFGGTEVKVDGQLHQLIDEVDVLGKYEYTNAPCLGCGEKSCCDPAH